MKCDNMKCKCGKEAYWYIMVPIYNVYAGLMNLHDRVPLCEYHKNKAKKRYEIYVI
jgi:hypothetical protein